MKLIIASVDIVIKALFLVVPMKLTPILYSRSILTFEYIFFSRISNSRRVYLAVAQ